MEYKGPSITLWFLLELLFGNAKGNFALCVVVLNGLWVLLLRRGLLGSSLPFRTLTLPSFFILAYCGLMLAPSAIWFAHYSAPVTFEYFAAVQALPTFFIGGVALANSYFPSPARTVSGFFRSDIFASSEVNKAVTPVFILAGILELLIATTYVFQAELVPLFQSFRKERIGGDAVRFAVYASGPVMIFLYAFTVRLLVPITVLYPLYMKARYGAAWRRIFWVTLALGLGISLLTLERQSSLSLFCLLILSIYFLQEQRIRLHQLLVLGVFLAMVGGFVSLSQFGHQLSFSAVAERAVSYTVMRLLLDPSYMAYVIFENYAGQPLLFGSTIRILSVFGVQYEHLTAIGFLADLWANYGWIGVIVGPVVLGFFLQFVQLHFFKARTVPTMIIYSMMMLSSGWLIFSNMMPTMVVAVFASGMLLLDGIRRLSMRAKVGGNRSSSTLAR